MCSNDGLNGKGGGELAQSLTYFFAEPPPRPHLLFPPKCFLGVCINARVIHPRIKHFAVYQIFDALYSPPLRATNQLGMAFLSAADFLGQRLETPIQVHIPPMAAIRSGAFSSPARCMLRRRCHWRIVMIFKDSLIINTLVDSTNAPSAFSSSPGKSPSEPRLLDQVRAQIRLRHYSIRTESQ